MENGDKDLYTVLELAQYYDIEYTQAEYIIKSNGEITHNYRTKKLSCGGRPSYVYDISEVGYLFENFSQLKQGQECKCPRDVKPKDCLSCKNLEESVCKKTGEELYCCKVSGDLCFYVLGAID